MKRLIFLIVAVFAIMFTGCSKDKDDTDSLIIGKWEATANYYLVDGVWERSPVFYDDGTVYEFRSNGKAYIYEDGELDSEVSYSYNSSNNQITIFSLVCHVQVLTETHLEIIGLTWDDDRDEYKTVFRRIE